MKHRFVRLLIVIALSASLFIMCGVAPAPSFADETITVTGVLTLDSEGGMVIKSGGKTYLVEGGDGLEDKLDQTVTLTGVVEKNGDGTLFLIVTQ